MLIEASCKTAMVDVPGLGEVPISECDIDPGNVFIALFAIFFGANQMGTAAAMGPDFGKASIAATKIFNILEAPS